MAKSMAGGMEKVWQGINRQKVSAIFTRFIKKENEDE